jgi:hypothetical protein
VQQKVMARLQVSLDIKGLDLVMSGRVGGHGGARQATASAKLLTPVRFMI